MRRRMAVALCALATWSWHATARGQGPTIDPTPAGTPGSMGSSLGSQPGSDDVPPALPGSGASPADPTVPTQSGYLGTRPGAGAPRIPFSITRPAAPRRAPAAARPVRPEEPDVAIPVYTSLDLPGAPDSEGPPGGLDLDNAIALLIARNPTLRAQAYELPQADADVLTAGLRANPILYADSQLIPYGNYSRQRPGGPIQYDLNISYPLDLSGKRRARLAAATQARRVIEAQYQDAVRLQIDNLYGAFVDALAARETVRFARAGVEGTARVLDLTEKLLAQDQGTIADVDRVESQAATASIALDDAEAEYDGARQDLGLLLDIPPAEARGLEPLGSLRDPVAGPPPLDALIQIATRARPDLSAYRIGLQSARANVDLQRANRFPDTYVLYQPYTFQDNSPFGTESAHSWALGVTVPLPLYNRNQGNIRRARFNVCQTQAELYALERRVAVEVEAAEREYQVSRRALARIETELLPTARDVRDKSAELYAGGEIDAVAFLNAQREFNDVVRRYRDALVRHRQAMLDLNTAVGHRVLP